MKLLFENWKKYLNEQNIMDKLANLEDERKKDIAQQITDAAKDVLLQRPLGTHEEHVEGAYEKLSDELKPLADELVAFNREQFGLDVGK
jgi:hypothetical protein